MVPPLNEDSKLFMSPTKVQNLVAMCFSNNLRVTRWGNDDQVIGGGGGSSSDHPPASHAYDNVDNDPTVRENPDNDNDGDNDEDDNDEEDANNLSGNNDKVLRFISFLFADS